VGTTESNGSDGHNRESWQIRGRATEGWPEGRIETLGKVEKDCREAAPKEEQVGKTCESNERERTSQMKAEAGQCLDKPSWRCVFKSLCKPACAGFGKHIAHPLRW